MTRPKLKNPKILFLEPFCNLCFPDEDNYFSPEPHGRQWAKINLWLDFECEKCGEKIISPVYQLSENPDRGKEGDGTISTPSP